MSAGVHRKCATNRTGNSCEKFRRTQTPADALARELRARHTTAGADDIVIDLTQVLENTRCRYNNAAQSAIANQQIAADTVPEDRRCRIQFAQEQLQVLDTGRYEELIGITACAP